MTTVLIVCMQALLAMAGDPQDSEGWTGTDVGKVTVAGTATYNAEAKIWTVRSGGFDIEGIADSFHYVHGSLEGDGFIIAKVERIGQADPWAKCGIMIRENAAPASRFAAIFVTPGNGVRFQARVNAEGNMTHDTTVATKEQKALKAPVWIKLERKQDQFYGYYATDKAGTQWTPMVWKPQAITMSRVVQVGLAMSSHAADQCEAWFSNVGVPPVGGGIIDLDLHTHPKEALGKAYSNLEQLGDWRQNKESLTQHGALIAQSLYTIARARDIGGTSAQVVLPDYYRLTQLLPDSRLATEALARIAVLGGQEGLRYATQHLEARPPEDRDRFYVAVMRDYRGRPGAPGTQAVIESFVQHAAQSSRFAAVEQVITDLGSDERSISVCKNLVQQGMAQPSTAQVAVVGLRYMALKTLRGEVDPRIQELLQWAETQFKNTKLSVCATAALADTYYMQASYAKVIDAFQPEFFSGNQSEAQMVENLENILASYRANTLLQTTIAPERIYEAVSQKAGPSGHPVVDLHCQRRIAELRGLSLEGFEQSAVKGVKHCESGPEKEVWFWRGLIAAGEGDLGAATAAYEHFLQGDEKSVLAARAYYDIARTKMALGEDAKVWTTKAKALSPCDAVLQLEQRLGTTASARGAR
jgi:hypothetical protein